jgi:hypothetical protein
MASVPGRICLAGEAVDWMTGGASVTAAIPLYTRVSAWRASGADALALTSGAPLYRTRVRIAQLAGCLARVEERLSRLRWRRCGGS